MLIFNVMAKERITVISLGGSLVVPRDTAVPCGIDTTFVQAFRERIMARVAQGERFVIIVGGGRTARAYVESAAMIDGTMTDEDKDWIGIHATRLNAHMLRTIFRTVAHPRVNDNPHDYAEFLECKEPVVIASGWRPGFSTDFDAVVLGYNLGARTVVNLSNIDGVYDKDPRLHKDAKRYDTLTWEAYRALIGDAWRPGMHAPFDPVAARFAQEHDMTVVMVDGTDLAQLDAYLDGASWRGTQIANTERA